MDFHCEGCSASKILEVSSSSKEFLINKVSIPKDDKMLNWKIPSRIGRNNRPLVRRGWGKWWDERQPCVKGPGLLLEAKTEDCLSNLTEDVKDDNSLRCHLICQPGPKRPSWAINPEPWVSETFPFSDWHLTFTLAWFFTYLECEEYIIVVHPKKNKSDQKKT